jgi:PAS domain S-box-containing protein
VPEGIFVLSLDITKRVEAEAELKRHRDRLGELVGERTDELARSGQRYRALFDTMTEGFALHEIVCDAAGKPCDYRFLDVNPAFEKLTGLRREDVVGNLMTRLLPTDDPTWIENYGRVALSGEPARFENHSPALKRTYEVFAYRPAPRQFAVMFTDVTERRQVVGELRESEARFKRLNSDLEQKVRERTADLEVANRTLRMISQCNEALLRATSESELVREVCRIIHATGGFRMVWVGYAEDDGPKTVRPVASAGLEEARLEAARVVWSGRARGRSPAGTCIRVRKTRVCGDYRTDPRLSPWREGALEQGLRSSIALPLLAGPRAFGALMIYSGQLDAFSEDMSKLLRELANNLAFGIMALRTRAERDHARGVAEKQAAQLRALTVQLGEVEQRERRRLAKILHDHLQQLLVGAKFNLGSLRGKLRTETKKRVVKQVAETLDGAIEVARSLSVELSPPVLETQGLGAALEWLGRQLGERLGLDIAVHVDPRAEPETEQLRLLLFDAVREMLLNVAKHSGVKRARVRLSGKKDHVQVMVSDEGRGFAPDGIAEDGWAGFGLVTVREQLRHLGGRLVVDAAPGRGSRITLIGPRRRS